jgi:hypothetical protein
MKVNKETRDLLIQIQEDRKLVLEGNILKILEPEEGDSEFSDYLKYAIERDRANRIKRLEVTKQVQSQNRELIASQEENIRINEELKEALTSAELSKIEAEKAKDAAITDLDLIQKKSQFELIGRIVKIALIIICGVGVVTTIMYGISMLNNSPETHVIGTAWSNMLGILLTNAFSIVGTIMGVKYASGDNTKNNS